MKAPWELADKLPDRLDDQGKRRSVSPSPRLRVYVASRIRQNNFTAIANKNLSVIITEYAI
jgi:hypothetical protein